MTVNPPLNSGKIAVRTLKSRADNAFLLRPDSAARARIAAFLGFDAVEKLRFEGTLCPDGREDWLLSATLGATIVQPCIVTQNPVTTRIDTPVRRRLLADPPRPDPADEAPFDGDDAWDALESEIDLHAIMCESLALAAPEFPRQPGAKLENAAVSPPGVAAIDAKGAKPFASLAALRDKLKE